LAEELLKAQLKYAHVASPQSAVFEQQPEEPEDEDGADEVEHGE
jgi:hypothetical protein